MREQESQLDFVMLTDALNTWIGKNIGKQTSPGKITEMRVLINFLNNSSMTDRSSHTPKN